NRSLPNQFELGIPGGSRRSARQVVRLRLHIPAFRLSLNPLQQSREHAPGAEFEKGRGANSCRGFIRGNIVLFIVAAIRRIITIRLQSHSPVFTSSGDSTQKESSMPLPKNRFSRRTLSLLMTALLLPVGLAFGLTFASPQRKLPL